MVAQNTTAPPSLNVNLNAPDPITEAQEQALAAQIANAKYNMENAAYSAESAAAWAATNPEIQARVSRSAAQQDAISEAQKHTVAFSQPRNDLDTPRSARYEEIIRQYSLQHNRVISGSTIYQYTPSRRADAHIDTSTAAGIAELIGSQGGAINPFLAETAIQQGYTGNLFLPSLSDTSPSGYAKPVGEINFTTDLDWGIHTEPIKYQEPLSNVMPEVVVPISDVSKAGTVDIYVPYGEYTQTRIPDAKLLLSETGELGIYQQPYGHSIYNLVGGGGRAAIQSGMFTINTPQTPYVAEQRSVGSFQRPSGEGLSRLGSEAYGGYVTQLDSRTIESTGATLSTYLNPDNLARFVNPQSVNLSKEELPGADIPWSVPASAPAIQRMDEGGIIPGSAIAISPTVATTTSVGSTPYKLSILTGVTGVLPNEARYAYRGDTAAVIMEGFLYLGDALTFGLWKPGSELLTRYGQNYSPEVEEFQIGSARLETQVPTYQKLGESIATQRGELEQFAEGKINAEGKFSGTPAEYSQYQTMVGNLNADVQKYNKFEESQKELMIKGYSSGAILPTGTGGYMINPEHQKEYGAFSDWSRGAGQWIQRALGQEPVTEAQFIAFEQTPEFKSASPIMQFGEGAYKVIATDPASLGGAFIQGVEIYAGMGVLNLGLGAIAAPAGAAPSGVLQTIGTTGQTVLNSALFQYGLGAALVGGTIYSASGGGTLPMPQTLSNIGGSAVHLTAMGWGGFAPEIFASAGRAIPAAANIFQTTPRSYLGGRTTMPETPQVAPRVEPPGPQSGPQAQRFGDEPFGFTDTTNLGGGRSRVYWSEIGDWYYPAAQPRPQIVESVPRGYGEPSVIWEGRAGITGRGEPLRLSEFSNMPRYAEPQPAINPEQLLLPPGQPTIRWSGGAGEWVGFGQARSYRPFSNIYRVDPFESPELMQILRETPPTYYPEGTPTIDLSKAKIELVEMKPKEYVSPIERKMIITQYGLTEAEIAYAKLHQSSLNDILALREKLSVDVAPKTIDLSMETTYPKIETVARLEDPFAISSPRAVAQYKPLEVVDLGRIETVPMGKDSLFDVAPKTIVLTTMDTMASTLSLNIQRSMSVAGAISKTDQTTITGIKTIAIPAVDEISMVGQLRLVTPVAGTMLLDLQSSDYARAFGLVTTQETTGQQDYSRVFQIPEYTPDWGLPGYTPAPPIGSVPPYKPVEPITEIPPPPFITLPWGGGGGGSGGAKKKRHKKFTEIFSFNLGGTNFGINTNNPFGMIKQVPKKKKT